MRTIILDTDIGDDIDDALALALIVNSPELELAGVTTVFLNAVRRGKLAARLLGTYGRRDVTVHAGLDVPLVQDAAPLLQEISGRAGSRLDARGEYVPCQFLDDMESEREPGRDAVAFIVDAARASPGRIELVCIGALTNAAIALRMEPRLPRLLSGITLMGGMFGEQLPEWNIRCDPEAARIVFTSGARLRCVGLDVTLRCRLEHVEVERLRRAGSDAAGLLGTLVDRWLANYHVEQPILHDPLAVSTLLDDDVVKFERRLVTVGLEGPARGVTLSRRPAKGGPVSGWREAEIAVDVQRERFTGIFLDRVAR